MSNLLCVNVTYCFLGYFGVGGADVDEPPLPLAAQNTPRCNGRTRNAKNYKVRIYDPNLTQTVN